MRLKLMILPFILFLVISCGNNIEFKKVYDYYNKPEDSLKLKAAEFLIQNMKGKYYYSSENDENIDLFFKNVGSQISVPRVENIWMQTELRRFIQDDLILKGLENGSLPKPKYERYYDVETIKAEFLIENIEYAFKAWEFPWSRDYSFDNFCKYILPYRYGNEAPSAWRKGIFEEFKWIADSLKNATALEATIFINKQFQPDFYTSKVLGKNGFRVKVTNQLHAGVFVDCFDQAGLGVCVLRSLGIPSVVGKIPKGGSRNSRHDMTAIFSLDDEWIDFNFGGPEHDPVSQNLVKAPKMFINRFDKYEDATSKLMNTIDLEVNVTADESDEIYLCVFSSSSWYPLYKGENLKSKVIFTDVGNNSEIMFIAATKSEGKLFPVSPVFKPDSLGNISYYKPNLSKQFTASFNRKYPGLKKGVSRLKDLIGGVFSISDTSNFISAKQLYRVDTILSYRDNIIEVPKQNGKFVKYDFPQSLDWDFDGPAEISFYTTKQGKQEKIHGKYFGSHQLTEEHINKMTDNDVLSFVRVWDYKEDVEFETREYIFRKEKQPIWIGMKMDSITTITHVGICPRNDKNDIYPGMNYELFYWDNAWFSLGEKTAKDFSITYGGIPENALLWLRNLDEGKEERIFTLADGEQIWW